jgi:hypothetical protein
MQDTASEKSVLIKKFKDIARIGASILTLISETDTRELCVSKRIKYDSEFKDSSLV